MAAAAATAAETAAAAGMAAAAARLPFGAAVSPATHRPSAPVHPPAVALGVARLPHAALLEAKLPVSRLADDGKGGPVDGWVMPRRATRAPHVRGWPVPPLGRLLSTGRHRPQGRGEANAHLDSQRQRGRRHSLGSRRRVRRGALRNLCHMRSQQHTRPQPAALGCSLPPTARHAYPKYPCPPRPRHMQPMHAPHEGDPHHQWTCTRLSSTRSRPPQPHGPPRRWQRRRSRSGFR
eukprot:scaffold2668_cov115-Isochrysis_galbana.AAC.15